MGVIFVFAAIGIISTLCTIIFVLTFAINDYLQKKDRKKYRHMGTFDVSPFDVEGEAYEPRRSRR